MELGLEFQEVVCYEAIAKVTTNHEESLETAIPEYCPDVARIVDAVGQLFIREKNVTEETGTVFGTVKVTVLYTSEEATGLRSLNLTVPFSCVLDDRSLRSDVQVCVSGRVLLTEVKALTSRKLYIRVLPEITATGYHRCVRRICTGLEEDANIRLRRREVTLRLLGAVAERDFTFAQETVVEQQLPEDLLHYRLCPSVSSVQRLGSKLVVKGDVSLYALYRDSSQCLRSCEASLPYSQIIEAADLPEDAEYTACPQLRECDVRILRTDSGGGFGITAQMGLCLLAYRTCMISAVADVYSTRCETVAEQDNVVFPEEMPAKVLRHEAQERLEFSHPEPFVFVTSLDCSPASVTTEDGSASLHTVLNLRLLYLDESGVPVGTDRSLEVCAAAGCVNGSVRVECCSVGVYTAGSITQLRIPVLFFIGCSGEKTVPVITNVTLETEGEHTACPSLILRRMKNGETLWDIAKQYRTDETAIRSANHLESDDATGETMLLIPRLR